MTRPTMIPPQAVSRDPDPPPLYCSRCGAEWGLRYIGLDDRREFRPSCSCWVPMVGRDGAAG